MKNANKVRNAQDAMAQAVRMERAVQMLKDGVTFEKDADFDIYAVIKPGTTAAAYFIEDGDCSCKDSLNGFNCKHEMALTLHLAETAPLFEDELIAACEASAAEYDNSRYHMPLPEVKHEAAHQALLDNRGNNPEVKPPFLFGQEPDARAVEVLTVLRERIFQERRNAKNLNWSGRVDDLATACTILDEFAVKYLSGWFEL